jgi:glycosyltransferase involved in cell wall biosynthesis
MVTKGVWGGAQKYVYSIATNLPKNLYDVFVITGRGEILKNKLEKEGIRVYEISNLKRDISIFSEIKSFISVFKILRKESPDVLHLNSPKAGGIGSVVGKILGIKNIILTAHGWTFNENRGIFSKLIIIFLSWFTALLCHKTIVIADREMKQGRRMPFVKNKIVLIKNGVENIDFKEKKEAQKELFQHINKTPINNVLWLGTIAELHKNKGLEYAIGAVAKIETPVVFFIIGEGEERKNLERMIEKHNLENRVFLVGFLENAKEYLRAFDIFTLTSIKEGLPYTILEAGLAGLPVVASNIGGIPDIIDNGLNGILVEKTNIEQITKTIELMIRNPDQRKSFGLKLQEKVEKEFSLKQMLNKTLQLYNF